MLNKHFKVVTFFSTLILAGGYMLLTQNMNDKNIIRVTDSEKPSNDFDQSLSKIPETGHLDSAISANKELLKSIGHTENKNWVITKEEMDAYSIPELESRVDDLEQHLSEENFIERANSNELSQAELKHFGDVLNSLTRMRARIIDHNTDVLADDIERYKAELENGNINKPLLTPLTEEQLQIIDKQAYAKYEQKMNQLRLEREQILKDMESEEI